MTELTKEQVDDIIRRLGMHPIEYEERINTLDKPLIIESECPGHKASSPYSLPSQCFPALTWQSQDQSSHEGWRGITPMLYR